MTQLLPQGKHRARAREWAIGEAGTRTKQIGVDFDLLDRPGESIPWYGYFTEKALASTVKALRAMGWQGADVSDLDNRGGGLDANEVTLVVEHEPELDEQGVPMQDESGAPMVRARVRWVNGQGGVAMAKALTGNDLRAFGAQLRGAILALDPNSAARRATQQAPKTPPPPARKPAAAQEPPPPGDADCPF